MFVMTKVDRKQWEEFVTLEPALGLLMGRIQAVQDDPAQPHFCANAHWYGEGEDKGFKDVLCQLVGWEAAPGVPPILRTQAAYDLCYDVLYAELPACQACRCI